MDAEAALSHAGVAAGGALEYRLSSSLSSFTQAEEDPAARRKEAALLNDSKKTVKPREIQSNV